MRAVAFAIAALLGGTAAVAQTTTDTGTNMGSQTQASTTANMDNQTQPSTTGTANDTNVQTQTGWNGTTTTTTATGDTTMASNTGLVVQPGNTAPRRDARGVRVISAPAVVPIGYNGTTGAAMGGPLVDPSTGQAIDANTSSRPCTRTVTDHCLQTYERRRAR